MQQNQNTRSKNLILGIIIFNIIVYAVQLTAGKGFFDLFALTAGVPGKPHFWSFLTYAFLHSTQGIFHLLGNMVGVFFLGRALLPALGEKRFIQLYLGSSVLAGLVWYFVSFASGSGAVVGASGAVFGLITCFGLMYAESDIYLMMVIRMKAKVLVYISLGIAGFGLIFFELMNGHSTAHSAHLGGMLGGFLFYKFIYLRKPGLGKNDAFKMPGWFKPKPKKPTTKSFPYKVNISQPRDLKMEVDRILDKINSKGFGALTDAEKKILDDAGDLLKKR